MDSLYLYLMTWMDLTISATHWHACLVCVIGCVTYPCDLFWLVLPLIHVLAPLSFDHYLVSPTCMSLTLLLLAAVMFCIVGTLFLFTCWLQMNSFIDLAISLVLLILSSYCHDHLVCIVPLGEWAHVDCHFAILYVLDMSHMIYWCWFIICTIMPSYPHIMSSYWSLCLDLFFIQHVMPLHSFTCSHLSSLAL